MMSGGVHVIDGDAFKEIEVIPAGIGTHGLYPSHGGRKLNVVYAIDTATGQVTSIPVGREPHGLAVWPQPGRYSLGHTGNMR